MTENAESCSDPRGGGHLKSVLNKISEAMGCTDPWAASKKFDNIVTELGMFVSAATVDQFKTLKTSVNPTRLKNHPITLKEDMIDMLYHKILREEK